MHPHYPRSNNAVIIIWDICCKPPPYVLSNTWLVRYSICLTRNKEKQLSFETAGVANALAQLAWNPANKTPFTVDIRGGWGTGKDQTFKGNTAAYRW